MTLKEAQKYLKISSGPKEWADENSEFQEVIDLWLEADRIVRANLALNPKNWIDKFETRFEANPHLHEGIKFKEVERALRADPDAMRAFKELDKYGHETNVFGEDADVFEIGTCSSEAASGHRNIVYNKAVQESLEELDIICNGNAVDLAKKIGVDLMDEDQINQLIKKLNKNNQRLNYNSWDWLKTDTATRKRGLALCVAGSEVYKNVANRHSMHNSFRAVRRVKKV